VGTCRPTRVGIETGRRRRARVAARRFANQPLHVNDPTAAMAGDVEPLPHWAGQGVGLVTREESAADIVHSLVTEAEEVLKSLA
jgi:NAD(P)H-dependent flavin oxidoreductase YrpB (nitropropane dioxygenase family)